MATHAGRTPIRAMTPHVNEAVNISTRGAHAHQGDDAVRE